MISKQDENDLDSYRALLERAGTPPENISRIMYEFAKEYCNPAEKGDIDAYLQKHGHKTFTQRELDNWRDDD